MNEIKYYELNSSQDVVKLQCKYTLFKRVINILTSATANVEIDAEIMEKALNKVIERNDCLRIRFVKKHGKLMQYFESPENIKTDITYVEFKTQEEQDAFIMKTRKKAIKYKKGVVIEPYFCKTHDNKFMMIFKVCHLILDIYGINNIYKDLFEVYEALKENKELPPLPGKFEDLLVKDIKVKNNEEINKRNEEFFTKLLSENEKPYYAGIHGPNEPIYKKQIEKGERSQKMFFIKNDTQGFAHHIDKDLVSKALEYCMETKCSISNFLFYAMSVCSSKINNDVKNMLPLEMCNCRGTVSEKKAAGTKVQSIACYTTVDKEKSFEENFLSFSKDQNTLYRYIGYPDIKFEKLLHKIYKESLLNTFYSITFSFIPVQKNKNFDIQIYSNGKCALPAYIALMWDVDTNGIDIFYDCQTKIHTEQDVKKFHESYVSLITQVLNNPKLNIKEIKV